MWLHCCCAGLSRECFEASASSEGLFLCPVCQVTAAKTTTLLKEEVAALCVDLLQLKESVVALQASKPKSKETNLSWNVVAGRGTKQPSCKWMVPDHESRDTCKAGATQHKQPQVHEESGEQ